MPLSLIKSRCLLQGSRAWELRGCILPSPLPSCHALSWAPPRTLSQFSTVVSTLGTSFVDALLCQAYVTSMGGIQWRGQGGNCLYELSLGKALAGPHSTLELQLFREEVMMSFDVVIWRMERYLRHSPGEEIRKGGGGACLSSHTSKGFLSQALW